jgi:hypothetical protein
MPWSRLEIKRIIMEAVVKSEMVAKYYGGQWVVAKSNEIPPCRRVLHAEASGG